LSEHKDHCEASLDSIHVGDCLDVMKSLPDDHVDLVICSPPYEDARTYGIEFKLVITTNKTLGEIAGLYDDRIADRIAAGTVVNFKGKSRRRRG